MALGLVEEDAGVGVFVAGGLETGVVARVALAADVGVGGGPVVCLVVSRGSQESHRPGEAVGWRCLHVGQDNCQNNLGKVHLEKRVDGCTVKTNVKVVE